MNATSPFALSALSALKNPPFAESEWKRGSGRLAGNQETDSCSQCQGVCGSGPKLLLLFDADVNRFAQLRHPAGVSHPENRIIRGIGIRVATKVGKVDETNSVDTVIVQPVK